MTTRISAEFGDVDHFREQIKVWGWDLNIQQTEPGRLSVEMDLFHSDEFTAVRTSHSVGNCREIITPAGRRTFGLVVPDSSENLWCNQVFDECLTQMMPVADYVAANAGAHMGYQLSFTDEAIEECLEQLECADSLTHDGRRIELNWKQATAVSESLNELFAPDAEAEMRSVADRTLVSFLVSFTSTRERARPSREGRARAFERARQYINANLSEAFTLGDICRNIGASRRTLTTAFGEQLDLSPMRYAKLVRLNRVHGELKRASSKETKIVDVANAAGIWHMGQFARDYRALFGEPPSATLDRVARLR